MSGGALFSSHWHRVHDVKPRLASDVTTTRHVNRGRVSWVLKRRSGRDHLRVDAVSFALIDQLDGARTVSEIWNQALRELDQEAPTQDQWVALLADLHASELLTVERSVMAQPVFERRELRRKRDRRERHLNPLYLRFPILDPDRLLTRWSPLARAIFSRPMGYAWLLLTGSGLLALLVGWSSLLERVNDSAFPAPRVALMMLLVYPFLKLLHELGHGLAVKRFGGAVHEFGVALMVLMPVPYVDASESAAFADRRARLLVGGAGILVELAFAAIGALMWMSASGLLQDLGLALLLVGGLSTLFVNGNPLLRFDGYYLLSDALEIPNLATRARRATLARLQRLLRGHGAEQNLAAEDARERAWLLSYGVLSAVYRTGLMLWIAWWLSGRYPLLGGALAVFALVSSLLIPMWRGLRAVADDPSLQRGRSLAVMVGLPVLIATLLVVVPVPHASGTKGVVWLPDEAVVRAPGLCEVDVARVQSGELVQKGTPLFECLDPELALREEELLAHADELSAMAAGLMISDRQEYARLQAELGNNEAALTDVRDRMGAGIYQAGLDGRFDLAGTSALAGRVLKRGEIAAYVVPEQDRTVRVALAEREAGRVDRSLESVELRISNAVDGASVHRTRVLSRTPRPSLELASAALGAAGGGIHANDPKGDERRVLEPVFDVELAWPASAAALPIGAHVGVRFVHAPTPLAARLVDQLRQALAERARS